MKIKPEERNKVIVLSVALVLVFCLFGFTVFPRLLPHGPTGELLIGPNAHRTTSTSSSWASTPSRPSAPGLQAPITPLPAASKPVVVPPAAPGASDPFWRPLALIMQPQKPNAATTVRPNGTSASSVSSGVRSGMDKSAPWKTGGAGKLAVVPPPPLLDVSLQGIVQDTTAMAVLETGGQMKFLKVGEGLQGGWYIIRIRATTVTLRQGRREVVLTVGQTIQKEAAPEPQDTHGIATTLPPFHKVTLQQ
jgi:hypothetical protein